LQSEQSFDLAAPLAQVWDTLVDLPLIAGCLPGASVADQSHDGAYDGEFRVKIGPTAASYAGRVTRESLDETDHAVTFHAAGTDKRGQGGARATVVVTAGETGEGTHVTVASDYHITGRLARFGRGGTIDEIAEQLVVEFADALRRMLAGDQPTVEISAVAATELGIDPEPAVEVLAQEDSPEPQPQPEPEPEPQSQELAPAGLWGQARANPVSVAAVVLGFLFALRMLRRRG
jgi:carbon monoxide dehydrogenase subunit G